MASARFRQFGEIMKVEEQDDGTIMVFGIASSGSRDLADEVITPGAMKAALPDYSRFPALREMHTSSSAGRVTEASVDEDGFTRIAAHVVDPVAITKVKTKTYAGFSIGGRVLKRDPSDNSVITSIRLAEISLVDSPCNPDATLNMWKSDMTDYSPTREETIAEATSMATAAGTKRYKDFLFKAREALIQKALEADIDDDGDEEEAASEISAEETDVAKVDSPAVVVEPLVDPVAAFNAALEKAAEAVAPVAAPVVADGPVEFVDFAKVAAALKVVTVDDGKAPLAKGLYSVSRLADLMESFSYLQASLTWETEHEGDSSTQPAKAAAIVASMGALLVQMAQEEVAEVLASIAGTGVDIEIVTDDDDVIALGAAIVDLVKADTDLMEKAGARHSKSDMSKIQASHDHMTALGAKCASGNCEKADDAADLEKVTAERNALSKALTDAAPQVEEITKRFTDEVGTLRGSIEDLTKRLAQVESEPAAPKTAVGTLRAVTKGEDISPNTTSAAEPVLSSAEFEKAWATLSTEEQGMILLKHSLRNPMLIQNAARTAA